MIKESNYIDNKDEEQDFGAMLLQHEMENADKKIEIVKKINDLASNTTDWKEANKKFNDLLEEFHSIGYCDKKVSDKINSDLRESKNNFFQAKKAYYEKASEQFKENGEKKKSIIEQLKVIEYTNDLKSTDETVKNIVQQFYSIGFAGKDLNNKLFEEFKSIRGELNTKRRAIVENLKGEFTAKREKKKEIICKLKALVENENWKKASEQFNALCEEFKTIGFSGKEENEEISKEYKDAKNAFFNKRQEFFDKVKAENQIHIQERLDAIEALKALYNNENWKEASEKVRELSESFFKIGFCGKEENDRLINEFKEVRDGFYKARQDYFDNIKASRAEKQKDFFNSLITNKEEFISKLRGYIKQDEEKLEDFKDRLFNVRPGAKAFDIIENYQNIVEDIKNRIDSNKAKIKNVQSEIFEIKKQIEELNK
ncbi:DUF349 domain-containing protein [Clostridium tarantellae]|uniref:DUF349 domain-containing protein n=1 Tax=Clostridium tarantellae TaxID=39493 RepID=A0A6I1ML76_9CLOT|nr:DUF349 domain-containing protein [Clostridium tarantellae]MPQ43493.1 DUF349 domain-containing protein [Clostridium tarantellae]